MFRMYASNSHRYTHLILALGIVREPTVWVFITSNYPGIHDIRLANSSVIAVVATQVGTVQDAHRAAPGLGYSIVWLGPQLGRTANSSTNKKSPYIV